jgi:hypothetical protein
MLCSAPEVRQISEVFSKLGGQRVELAQFRREWDDIVVEGLPKTIQIQQRMGGHGLSLTDDKLACFKQTI